MSTAIPDYESSLAEITSRFQLATEGPWRVVGHYVESARNPACVVGVACERQCGTDEMMPSQANAEFIASARTDIPALVDEVGRLRAVLRRIVEDGQLDAREFARRELDAGQITE